jgi:hypothetical protein
LASVEQTWTVASSAAVGGKDQTSAVRYCKKFGVEDASATNYSNVPFLNS